MKVVRLTFNLRKDTMKKIMYMCAAVAAMSFTSCVKDNLSSGNEDIVVTSFYATSGDVDSKTLLAENNEVHWVEGDIVKVVLFPATSGYKLQSNEFTANFFGESSSSAHFTTEGWSIDNSWAYDTYVFACYPASVAASSYVSSSVVYKTIQYNLPTNQAAIKGSFANNLNLSYAVGLRTDFLNNTATLYFKNACALLRVNIPEVENLVSLTVTSSSDIPLTGMPSNLSYSGSGEVAKLTLDSSWNSKSSIVTISDDNGMSAGSYYFVVWPGSHSGLSFKFLDKNGNNCVKDLNGAVTFSAGRIETVNFKSAIEFSQDPYVNLSTDSINATARTSTYKVGVEANNPISVSSTADWFTTNYSDGQCTITVKDNISSSDRSASVTVAAGGVTKNITVSQPCIKYRIVSQQAIQNASDYNDGSSYLEDNDLYIIANKGTGKFITANSSIVSFESISIDNDIYTKNVFRFWRDKSKIQTFDTSYKCNTGGTFYSLYQGAYLSSNATFDVEYGNSQYLSISNRWGTDDPGDMDVYKYNAGTTSLWVDNNNSSVLFDGANYNTDTKRRKWVFYEVVEQ